MEKATRIFECSKGQLVSFRGEKDPFNPKNVIEGFLCKKKGNQTGSLFIVSVNGEQLEEPQSIWGVPSFNSTRSKGEWANLICKEFLFSRKHCGENVQFFVYKDKKMNKFVSAKERQSVFVKDTQIKKFISEKFGEKNRQLLVDTEQLPDALKNLNSDFQSISFELCGTNFPQLLKYDFESELKELFMIDEKGKVYPSLKESEKQIFISQKDLQEKILEKERIAEENNEQFKMQNRLEKKVLYSQFIDEGYVLYLLDESGSVKEGRRIFKVKPKQLLFTHQVNFDSGFQLACLEAFDKIAKRGDKVGSESMRKEMDLSQVQFRKWEKEILSFVKERPHPSLKPEKESKSVLLILNGLPGKSPF